MKITPLQGKINEFSPSCALKMNESMGKHTSFRIGGEAEIMAFPKNTDELAEILKISRLLDCKCRILGAGTNVLAPDEGVEGIVICLKDGLNDIKLLENNRFQVFSGVTMTRAAVFAANAGLSGMEFAHGIPGTVGGGVYMNAGAYGGEMKDVLHSVTAMDMEGNTHVYTREELALGYRHSALMHTGHIVTSATVVLRPGDSDTIRTAMREFIQRRRQKQPIHLPSCGSTFKRPEGHFAGTLIEGCGLKGFRIGGASVSELHAGFLVNDGEGTAADYLALIAHVQKTVFDKHGVRLEPEVRILGEEAPLTAL